MMPDRWLIWSFEHNAWWGPNHYGYVDDIDAAGRYSFAEALDILKDANITKPNEAMLPEIIAV